MIVVRDRAHLARVRDERLRKIIANRIEVISDGEPYCPEDMGYFVVIEPGDTVQRLEQELGFSPLGNRFTDKHFGDEGYWPCTEVLEDMGYYFDLVYVIGDYGFGVNVFVLKDPGVAPELMALCEQFNTGPGAPEFPFDATRASPPSPPG